MYFGGVFWRKIYRFNNFMYFLRSYFWRYISPRHYCEKKLRKIKSRFFNKSLEDLTFLPYKVLKCASFIIMIIEKAMLKNRIIQYLDNELLICFKVRYDTSWAKIEFSHSIYFTFSNCRVINKRHHIKKLMVGLISYIFKYVAKKSRPF